MCNGAQMTWVTIVNSMKVHAASTAGCITKRAFQGSYIKDDEVEEHEEHVHHDTHDELQLADYPSGILQRVCQIFSLLVYL